jgi:hypothetical protein
MNKLRPICASALFLLSTMACGQQPGTEAVSPPLAPGSPQHEPELRAGEGLLHLDVVVTDKLGRPVTGLKANDFALLDNGQPNKIQSFQAFDGISAKPNPPVEVILVMDAANHSSDEDSDEHNAVDKFLRQNGGHLAQPVSIYRLSNEGLFATARPSSDGNALAAEISQKGGLRDVTVGSDDLPFNVTLAARSPSFRNPSYHPQSSVHALGSTQASRSVKTHSTGSPNSQRAFERLASHSSVSNSGRIQIADLFMRISWQACNLPRNRKQTIFCCRCWRCKAVAVWKKSQIMI